MSQKPRLRPVLLEECRIIFRNFSGAEGKFNPAGKRNFNVILGSEEAEMMLADGWNVKYLQPREEGDEPLPRLEVEVKWSSNPRSAPPRIYMLTSRGKTSLDEETVGILDWAEIAKVDLTIRPYEWEVNGRSGVKAYLKTIFVHIVEDELELKYQDVPDTAQAAMFTEPDEDEDDEAPF